MDEIPKAIHTYTRVLLIRDFNNDGNDPVKAAEAYRTMGMWAECFLQLGQLELARDAFKKIEQTAIEYFGEQSLQRGQAFQSLGNVHVELGQWKEAEVAYKLALSLDKCGKSTENVAVSAGCHYNLGLLLSAQDRHPEAAEAFRAAVDKKTLAGSPDDAGLVEAHACLSSATKGERAPGAPEKPAVEPAATAAVDPAAAAVAGEPAK